MSKIFLPNGGIIHIHNDGWTQTTLDNGNTLYKDKAGNFLGSITAGGIVHLTDQCRHTYYPPPISSLDEAYKLIRENIRKLPDWRLKELKTILQDYNARSNAWK